MAVKRERLHLSRYQSVETYVDGWNGRAYIACSSNASMLFRNVAELRRFLKLPKGIASREAFDSWIASLEAADAERTAKRTITATSEPVTDTPLSPELLATGFGPECHEEDPALSTKMVI